MSRELYACVHATEFAAQALLRLRTDLKGEPVAIVEGPLHDACVCSMNRAAAQRGVVRGLPRMDAEALNGLKILDRSLAVEQATRAVMLEVAAQFTPRMEVVPAGVGCSIVLDVMGSELLFGPPNVLATKIRDAMEAVGLRVSVVLSANFHTARLKAAAHRGLCIVAVGAEADTLALLPLHALDLSFEQQEKFELWGIRSFADLAALPEAELIARLGARAREWQAMARGAASHTFQPIEAAFALREVYEFDTPVELEEGLLFMAARMLDCLVDRAMAHALALASLTAELVLEGAPSQSLSVHPALPSQDKRFLLKLLQMELTTGPHPFAYQRNSLRAMGCKTAAELVHCAQNVMIHIAGCVIARQRPGTAKGFVFLSLEDETGIANIILTPDLFERERLTVTHHRFLHIHGLLQNNDGVVHVKAKTIAPFKMPEVAISSHDFH